MADNSPQFFLLDVDGVFTDGTYYYTTQGKVMKKFGADDNDALSLLRKFLHVEAISGDKRGFAITKKRIEEDMGVPLSQVSTFQRIDWIKERFDLSRTIYMGDGIYDPLVFREVAYSIAPANAFFLAKKEASYVTQAKGGEGAVAEASVHILEKFFTPFNYDTLTFEEGSGAWK